MSIINARKYVKTGFPPDEGAKFAGILLDMPELDWKSLELDVTECTPSLLISAFINGFLQAILDRKPDLLPTARKIKWKVTYEFQRENIAKWVKQFRDLREVPDGLASAR